MIDSESLIKDLIAKRELRVTLSAIRGYIREGDKSLAAGISEDKDCLDALRSALDSSDPKERKSAVLLIGELPLGKDLAASFLKALMTGYGKERTLFVRESYLKSIRALSDISPLGTDDLRTLRARLVQIDSGSFTEEDMKHILSERKQLIQIPGMAERREAAEFVEPESAGLFLLPVKGLYRPLKEELMSRGIDKGYSSAGVLVAASNVEKVRDCRLYQSFWYRIRGRFSGKTETLSDEIRNSGLPDLLRSAYKSRVVSIRINVHQRKDGSSSASKRFAPELLYLLRGRAVNTAPYDLTLHFLPRKSGGLILFADPAGARDQRFSYVRERLSTSMQPVKAAIMVYLVRNYLHQDARVFDPFSGNGTLLLERDQYLTTRVMFAADTNPLAIRAGEENARLKGRRVYFVRRSAFTFESDRPFDEIISELPDLYEKSDADRDEFYTMTGETMERLLAPKGRAFLLAGGNEIKAMIRKSGSLSFLEEIPFDDRRSIYVIERI